MSPRPSKGTSESVAEKWRSEIRADLQAGLQSDSRLREAFHRSEVTVRAAASPRIIPPVEGRPPLSIPDDVPIPELTLPSFLRAGLTVTYDAGDLQNGEVRAAGVGYVNANVNFAAARLVTIDVRNYFIADPSRPRALSIGSTAVVGNEVSAGIYWIHPALLALLCGDGAPPQMEGVTVERVEWETARTRFTAVKITRIEGRSRERTVYDLATGLLLSQTLIDAAGPAKRAVQVDYRARRDLRIPWAQRVPPEWVGKTRSLRFEGSNTILVGTGIVRQPVTLSIELEPLIPQVLLARIISRVDPGAGFPAAQTEWNMVCAPAMVYPLWISPEALRALKPNQPIDEDPITRFRMTFLGIEDGRAAVVEQGPLEHTTYFFDARRGILLGFRGQRPYADGAGQLNTETWLRESDR